MFRNQIKNPNVLDSVQEMLYVSGRKHEAQKQKARIQIESSQSRC